MFLYGAKLATLHRIHGYFLDQSDKTYCLGKHLKKNDMIKFSKCVLYCPTWGLWNIVIIRWLETEGLSFQVFILTYCTHIRKACDSYLILGGQKARVNLARALYKKADIYILDDPLSAVDTHVGNIIFEQCLKQYLRDKTVILATHQLQYVYKADQVCLLNEGTIVADGSFAQVQAAVPKFFDLLLQESCVDKTDKDMQMK
jgi:ribosome biogenesis protein Tsr3